MVGWWVLVWSGGWVLGGWVLGGMGGVSGMVPLVLWRSMKRVAPRDSEWYTSKCVRR